jgi:hypothetical protein
MLIEDGLVVVDAYLDGAGRQLDGVGATRSTLPAVGQEAPDWFSASTQARRVSTALVRARTYVRAAKQTIGDIADDVACGADSRVGEDLRLLERQCALVDELSGHAARTLAATSHDHAEPDESSRALSADLSSIGRARSNAQGAARLVAGLAAVQRRAPVVAAEGAGQRLRAEQQGRWPARDPASAIGVPR